MDILVVNIFSIILQALATSYIVFDISYLNKNDSYTPRKFILFSTILLISFVIGTILKNLIPGVNTLFTILVEISLLTFGLKFKPLKSLFITILLFTIFAITEITSIYLTIFIFNVDTESIFTSAVRLLTASIMQIILITVIIGLFHIVKRTKPLSFNFFKDMNNKQMLLFAALLVAYIFPQMLIFVINSYSFPIPILVIDSIQFMLICVIAIIFVKVRVDYLKTQDELFVSELHNKTLVGMVDGVRTLKHDYNNIMQSLNGYMLTKQYDKLQNHINGVLKECNMVNNLAVIDPNIFNEPAIYGIVGAKYFLAEEKNVDFDFDIVTNIAEINFPKPALSRILGILLDNAIEATSKCDNPYMLLEMHFDKRKEADVIKIYNTYDTSIDINLTDIFQKGYSTKEVKSGIGLWEVQKIIKQNANSQIFASIEKDKFVQTIIIEKTEPEPVSIDTLETLVQQ